MFDSQKKNMSELDFWFGGRVYQEPEFVVGGASSFYSLHTMYLVVPPALEKELLFVSPLITARDLPTVIAKLTENGVSVLDI